MSRISDYALSELPTVMGIEADKLHRWVERGDITVTRAAITGVERVALTELPKIRALAEGREYCRRCNDSGRITDELGAKDCPNCVTPRDPNYVPSHKVETDGNGRFLGVTSCTCDDGSPTWPGHSNDCALV